MATQSQAIDQKPPKPIEYNPRWKGYCYIIIPSLVNFSAVSNIPNYNTYDGIWGFALSFGVFTFSLSLLILILDRTQFGVDKGIDYLKAYDGKVEGYTLLFMTVWWIIGAAYITQVNGIAYLALNVYFSAWLALAACVYTLDQWSASKDILSIKELTGVSATLKSWYILWISSLVVMGTSIEMIIELDGDEGAAFGIAFGGASAILAFGFILTHYNFIEFCAEGGWIEFFLSVLAIIMWIVGTAVLTQDGGIGSTITGFVYRSPDDNYFVEGTLGSEECRVVDPAGGSFPCDEFFSSRTIPGSNLYFSTWVSLLASIDITMKWKAQQAIRFAQAQSKKAAARASLANDDVMDENEDDDLDEFEDADDF